MGSAKGLGPEQARLHEEHLLRQMKLAEPYADSKPSEVSEVYWIYAERRKVPYPGPTRRSGKWLVLGDVGRIDGLWARVKVATESGRLGGRSKAATSKPNPTAADPNTRAICVYTYDSEDFEDVMRVRDELRALGVVEKIGYKTDEKTVAGIYVSRGYKAEEIRRYFD